MEKTKIGQLSTEARNSRTMNLDKMTSLEMVEAIIKEEERVVPACLKASQQLAKAVDLYAEVLQGKGRIIEAGSGCSGDYAATDVLELEATFGQKSRGYKKTDKVFALHLQKGWFFSAEETELVKEWSKEILDRDFSEDSKEQPKKDLDWINFNEDDLLVLITASGRSPAIVELAKEAKRRNGKVISIVMNTNTEISQYSDVTVEAIVGEPPLTGSGRMLAGTASKIIITTLSTAAHTKIGAVYSNLMVNLNVKNFLDNSKFLDRSNRIIASIAGSSITTASSYLEKADWDIKTACVMIHKKCEIEEAQKLLQDANYILRKIIN